MTFVPRHRKKRNPLDRQVLGTYRPPPANQPCARTACDQTRQEHRPKGMHERGECLDPRCECPGFLPPTREDT